MTVKEEVVEALVKKAAELFHKDPSTMGPETSFIDDLDAKSVNFVQFSAMLEDMYDVEVPFMEFKRKKTFADAGAYIASLLGCE